MQSLIVDYAASNLHSILFNRIFSDFNSETESVLLISAGSATVILIASLGLILLTKRESIMQTTKSNFV